SSVYDTDIFKEMFDVIGVQQEILSGDEVRKARIIVDHVRAAIFIVNDGVEPSNKDRGYVLRRLLRRAMVNARALNLQGHWLEALIGKVVDKYQDAYPELNDNAERIFAVMKGEQSKFSA